MQQAPGRGRLPFDQSSQSNGSASCARNRQAPQPTAPQPVSAIPDEDANANVDAGDERTGSNGSCCAPSSACSMPAPLTTFCRRGYSDSRLLPRAIGPLHGGGLGVQPVLHVRDLSRLRSGASRSRREPTGAKRRPDPASVGPLRPGQPRPRPRDSRHARSLEDASSSSGRSATGSWATGLLVHARSPSASSTRHVGPKDKLRRADATGRVGHWQVIRLILRRNPLA